MKYSSIWNARLSRYQLDELELGNSCWSSCPYYHLVVSVRYSKLPWPQGLPRWPLIAWDRGIITCHYTFLDFVLTVLEHRFDSRNTVLSVFQCPQSCSCTSQNERVYVLLAEGSLEVVLKLAVARQDG